MLVRAVADPDARVRLLAASALWYIGAKARPAAAALREALQSKSAPDYQHLYFEWAARKILERLPA